MTIPLDWLGDDYPTFPQFQQLLIAYEREQRTGGSTAQHVPRKDASEGSSPSRSSTIERKEPDNNAIVIGSNTGLVVIPPVPPLIATKHRRAIRDMAVYDPQSDTFVLRDGTRVSALEMHDPARHVVVGDQHVPIVPGVLPAKCRRCGKFYTPGSGGDLRHGRIVYSSGSQTTHLGRSA